MALTPLVGKDKESRDLGRKKRIVTLSFYVYLSESLVSGRVDQDLRSATELEERADECVITHLANPT